LALLCSNVSMFLANPMSTINFLDELESYYTVSEITRLIKDVLETSMPVVWVQGELSNFVHHGSGHMYFSLKDEIAQIKGVMWRGNNENLFFTPQDGMRVNAFGRIRVYEKRGVYQLDILKMVPAGIGDLQLAFEELKKRLAQEGLFESIHKKPLPIYPERIGIITSSTGAAIRDIVNVLNRRFPSVVKIIRPALVQGEDAAQDIASAIKEFNQYKNVDVLIVGRGGGSLEDLWAFNEEIVARAIFQSDIPVISAVGHEVDFTISDFVADMRAPTPSAAAEMVVMEKDDLLDTVQKIVQRCTQAVKNNVQNKKEQVRYIKASYGLRRPEDVVRQHRQRIDEITRTISRNVTHSFTVEKNRFDHAKSRLSNLHPASVLKRGYTITLHDGKFIKRVAELKPENSVKIQFTDGTADSSIHRINKDEKSQKIFSEWGTDE